MVVCEILKKKEELQGKSSACCVFSLLESQKCWSNLPVFNFEDRKVFLLHESSSALLN